MHIYSEYSSWWLLPILIAAFTGSYFFYKNQTWLSDVSNWVKRTLIGLRAISLFFIAALLIGIILEIIGARIEKPIIITLIDTSSSMKNYKDSTHILSDITKLNTSIHQQFDKSYNVETFSIGDKFKTVDKPIFNEQVSDLQAGFDQLASRYYNRNIGAIIFVSDGNFNKGSNPIYAAKNIPLAPIFTIGVGDTLPKRDQAIKEVFSNDFAFLRAKFPVEIELESTKLKGEKTQISIVHKGKVVTTKTYTYTSNNEKPHFSLEIDATEIGFQHYTVQLNHLSNEYTYKNNSYSFYVDVVDNRSKVLILSGAPHPDVTALKSALEKDVNIQVQVSNTTAWKDEYKQADLIIWHEPGIEFSAITNDAIKKLNKPTFYFIGPNTSSQVINQLNLGFSSSQSRQTDEVQPSVASNLGVFEIPTSLERAVNDFPPVFAKYGTIQTTVALDVLLYQKVGNVVKNDPLLFFGKKQQGMFGVFYGEGIWKWKLVEFSKTKNTATFDAFFQKVFNYVLVKQNTSALHITLPRKFSNKEEVKIKAEFYNASMELITKPEIQFELRDKQNRKSVYQFAVNSNFYTLPLGILKPGNYSWVASTVYQGKKHTKKGVFVVDKIQLEQVDTRSNFAVLRQIAKNSHAQFYTLTNANNIVSAINKREDIAPVNYEQKTTIDLLDYSWILLLIIACLCIEWSVKKWFGSY
jgi:hypothetical protein